MTMAVCAFVILFLSLLTTLTLVYFKREFKQSISSQQFTLLTLASQDIDQKLKAAQNTLLAVSREVPLEIVNKPDAAQRWLDNHPGTRSIFDNGLFLFSKEGRLIVESPYLPNRRGRDVSFRQFYKKTIATGQPVISVPYISTHTPNAPAVMFTAPVRDENGALVAILGGGLNLLRDNFLGEVSRTRIAKTGYLYLLTKDRTMIMHPDKSRIMALAAPPGANKLLDKALNGFEGGEENVNSRGLRALSSFKHLQTTDWILAANFPLAEAYEPVYRVQRYLLAAVIICAFLTLLVVRLMMGRYTNALVQFAHHVKHISAKTGSERLFPHNSADEIGILARTFNSMIQDQDRKSEELFHISTHDALSGVYNRAYFDTEVKRLSSGRLVPVSVVMADIDDLKVFNDTYGHSAGDRLIKTTARILLEAFRAEDVVARIGGDEFGVLLPGVDAEQAGIALKRIRRIADKYQINAEVFPISISLGCATTEIPAELEEAIKHADQQMYLDKVSRKMAERESEL
jgi:diguanylate cyclase (GGDEF)-like protein